MGAQLAGSDEILQRFVDMFSEVGGEGQILNDQEAALSVLRGLLSECHGQAALVPPDSMLESMAVPRIAIEAGCHAHATANISLEAASKAAIGITTALAGIADTGTIVLQHATIDDQLAALLPPVHVALLKRKNVYPDKISLLSRLREEGFDLGSNLMTWVTGPSLTADIEKVLVRGAHGPRRVIVLIY